MHKTINREPEVNKLLGRIRRGWEGSVEGTVQETVLVTAGWIHLAQDGIKRKAPFNTEIKFRVP